MKKILIVFFIVCCAMGVDTLALVVDWSQFNDSVLLQVSRNAKNGPGNTICTGVIVDPRIVLTTAHCTEGAQKITIVFDVENGKGAQVSQVILPKQMIRHPQYSKKKSLYENDLAKLILNEPAKIDKKWIRVIPDLKSIEKDAPLIRIGVGLRSNQNLRAYTDPKAVSVISDKTLEIADIFSYPGDSGGPIYTEKYDLISIHSTLDDFDGKASPKAYGVFLPAYRAWIFKSNKK